MRKNAPEFSRHLTVCSTCFSLLHNLTMKAQVNGFSAPLQWHHNEHDGISNHQPHDCFLLNCSFSCTSKKTSKLRVTGHCVGNSLLTVEFPAQRASNAKNVFIWWCHHIITSYIITSILQRNSHTFGVIRVCYVHISFLPQCLQPVCAVLAPSALKINVIPLTGKTDILLRYFCAFSCTWLWWQEIYVHWSIWE